MRKKGLPESAIQMLPSLGPLDYDLYSTGTRTVKMKIYILLTFSGENQN